MPSEQPDPHELAEQVQQHLESWRAAGVEWVPASSTPPAPVTAAPVAATQPAAPPVPAPSPAPALPATPVFQSSLFGPPAGEPLARGAGNEEQRRQELTVLSQEVASCQRCSELWSTRTQTVFGVGPLSPDLCFVGEAPGADEDRLGEPFVGAAGQLLNRIITACGLRREEVYILNILKCRPPGNRPPQPNEAHNCRGFLERQIELVQPRFFCAMGKSAVSFLTGTTEGITRLRGRFLEFRGIPVMCTFHPSYLLRVPTAKKDVWEDMKKLLARMGRPIPTRGG